MIFSRRLAPPALLLFPQERLHHLTEKGLGLPAKMVYHLTGTALGS